MSTATAENTTIETSSHDNARAYSEPVAKGDFPRSVNWGNPRVAAILEAAAHCFSSRGFTATTLADIGKELGLRKSIVHYYFTSKATLVQEVQSFAYGRYLQLIQAALAPSSLDARPSPMATGLRALWGSLREQGAIRGLNLELWSEGRRNDELSMRAQTLEAEAHKLIKAHLQHTKSSLDEAAADDLATLTLAVLDGLNVREEREGHTERTTKAFEAFLGLLDK